MAHQLKSSFWLHGLDSTIQSSRSGGSSNLSEKTDELAQITEDADKVADIFTLEIKRCAAEDRAKAAAQDSQHSYNFDTAELSRHAKSSVADAAKMRQARRVIDLEDNIVFGDDVLRTASEARTARSLASEVRHFSNKNLQFNKQVAALRKVVQTPSPLETPEPTDAIDRKAEAALIEEKHRILKKKLDNMGVPSPISLQKQYDENLALQSELNAARDRVKRYNGIPPSLVEATQKLEEAKEQLSTLRREIRKRDAKSYGFSF